MKSRALLLATLLSGATLAQADVVVVVSARSPAQRLDKAQVSDLFLGANRVLPGGGQVQLLSSAAPLRDEFYAKVLGRDATQVKAIWSRLIFSGKGVAPREYGNAIEIKGALQSNPNALAYIDRADVDASVRVVFSP